MSTPSSSSASFGAPEVLCGCSVGAYTERCAGPCRMDASAVDRCVSAFADTRSLTHTGAPRVHGPSSRTYPRPRPHTRSQPPGCPHPAVLLQAGQESVLGSSVGRRRRRSPIVRGKKKKQKKACARRRCVALGRGRRRDVRGASPRTAELRARGQRVSARLAGWKAELK